MKRHAGQYRAIESWTLTDRATGRDIGARQYPTLADALDKRAHLVEAARRVSQECAADVQQRCDVRRLP